MLTISKYFFHTKKNLQHTYPNCRHFWDISTLHHNQNLQICRKFQKKASQYAKIISQGIFHLWQVILIKMPATIWPQSGNHATLTLMPKFLLYSGLCCAHGCVYTCTVHTDCDCTVVLLTDQSIASIQGTPHTHQAPHRQSQMLSSGSPTKKTHITLCTLR